MKPDIKSEILRLAQGRCEYCKSLSKYSPQPFTIDHIIPIALGGQSVISNLALACGGGNGIKYIKISGQDAVSGKVISLFHPRNDTWADHFERDPSFHLIIGISP